MPSVDAVWVIGRYSGNRAKSVVAHSEAGIGYIILQKDAGTALAAFRIVPIATEGIPEHLSEVADPLKIREYEKTLRQRMGVEGRREAEPASEETVDAIRETLSNIHDKK